MKTDWLGREDTLHTFNYEMYESVNDFEVFIGAVFNHFNPF